MKWILLPVFIDHPYPTLGGWYRCFDGEKWHDCDRTGKIIR